MEMKIEAVLKKARRGQIADNLREIFDALRFLGWEVGYVPRAVLCDSQAIRYANDWREAPSTTPGTEVGSTWATNLKDCGTYSSFREWRILEVLRIVDASGTEFFALPDGYDGHNWKTGDKACRPRMGLLKKWLKETSSLKADAEKALGLGEFVAGEKKVREDYKNGAGTCPCCFQLHALSSTGTIVLHGYKRPGWGFAVGSCVGVGYPPFEISPAGTIALRDSLRSHKASREAWLDALQANRVEVLTERRSVASNEWGKRNVETVEVRKDDDRFAYLRDCAIRETGREIASLESDLVQIDGLIENWEARPLPKPGATVPAVWK